MTEPRVAPAIELRKTVFETEMEVRPDDIDLFRHVHSSKYQDYVLAARFDQMKRCYGVSMEAFMEQGLGWYVREFHIEYRRPLGLGDRFRVRTWIDEFFRVGVWVCFEIVTPGKMKLCCRGRSKYSLVRLETGRPESVPAWIVEKYSI